MPGVFVPSVPASILNQDFVSPGEVINRVGIVYSATHLELLKKALPEREVLEKLRKNNFLLIPSPEELMSLLDLRRFTPESFDKNVWYLNDQETFSLRDKVRPVWLMIRKLPVHGSEKKSWEDQLKLLYGSVHVPNVVEVAWTIIVCKKVRDLTLFSDVRVRTCSLDSDGNNVSIGVIDGKISLGDEPSDVREDYLGLAVAS
ncbi:MAG: hypothetical protein WAW90_02345 [Minisyncoccia bacterium]